MVLVQFLKEDNSKAFIKVNSILPMELTKEGKWKVRYRSRQAGSRELVEATVRVMQFYGQLYRLLRPRRRRFGPGRSSSMHCHNHEIGFGLPQLLLARRERQGNEITFSIQPEDSVLSLWKAPHCLPKNQVFTLFFSRNWEIEKYSKTMRNHRNFTVFNILEIIKLDRTKQKGFQQEKWTHPKHPFWTLFYRELLH